MNNNLKKLIAGGMVAALCLLSGCSGTAPDNREDPLAGHNVDALLPFKTREPDAMATATPTPRPESTSIVNLPQNWQNESAPENDKSTAAPTRTPAPAATAAPTYNIYTYTRLEQGDEGEEVLRLQNRLKELGYLTGNADGKFGANTKTAVKLFQKALGLSQTGVATVSLQEKLFISTAPVYVPSADAQPTVDASSIYQAMVRGDRSTEVQKLQRRLIELGYLTGTADGVFGANTENAVKAFQAQLGLSQTGVASAAMQSQLYSASAPYAPVQVTAVPTAAPTKAPTPPPQSSDNSGYQQLEPGDSGEAVVRMQKRLKELGYFSGNATGNYYKETTSAVQRFQAAIGQTQTGVATSATLTRLYASNAPAYSAATAEPTAAGYTTLSRGSKGTEVLNLQKRLRELGYLTSAADGDFGGATENAVRLFQSAVGYEQNGVASVGLQNLLFSQNAPVYIPVITAAPTAIPTVAPTQIPSAPVYAQLEPGNTGDQVKQLQSRLKELGFFSGLIGGNYLTKTTNAVRLFQAAIGHEETGIATPGMQAILFSNSAPTYESVESDYVDLEKQDSGIQVRNLQQRLKDLGYLTGTADGDYGSKTERAVLAFQQQAGLPATGKATAETQEVLFSSNAPFAPAPTNAPTEVPTQVPVQTTQAPQHTQTGTYPEYSRGSSGEGIKDIQRRLQELGYYEGDIGGNYLARTETAVRLFQAAIGYNQDGIATSSLQSLLFSSSAPAYDGRSFTTLQSGDKGLTVRRLQQRLIDLGYLTGTADGDFGGGTASAIKRYQAAIGYNQTGVATLELQQMLFSASSAPVQPQTPTTTNPPVIEDDSPRDLSYGDSGAQVKSLQQRLIQLGYLTGSADGDFGGATRSAVERFQKTINYYTQDGIATIELQQMIFSPSAPAYTAPETDTNSLRTLVHGNSGEDVKAIQRRLKQLGYFDGEIGGNYLTKTETAVKLFQETIGRPADGVATPEIQQLILSSDAPAYGSSGYEPPVNPVKPEHLTVLVRGDSGSHVKSLQQRLIYLGWLVGNADGDFGSATENALFAFQYRMGLPTDGVASIEAQEMLYDETAPAFVQYFDLLPGAQGEEVLAIQLRLIELGYLENKEANLDGIYGPGLMNALINLQLASGTLPELADGVATVDLQTFLFSENAALFAILPENM